MAKVRALMGLSEDESPEDFVQHLGDPRISSARVCWALKSLNRISFAMEAAQEMISDKAIKHSVRLKAMEMLALLSEKWVNSDARVSTLINEAAPSEKRRPMNAPPQMAVQINVPGKDAQVSIAKP